MKLNSPYRFLQRLSIDKKLSLMNVSVTVLALSFLGLMVGLYAYDEIHQQMQQNLETFAEVLSDNLKGALSFDDPKDAKDVLDSLSHNPIIMEARLLNARGELFAEYRRNPNQESLLAALDKSETHTWHEQHLFIKQSVTIDGRFIGSMMLLSDDRPLHGHLKRGLLVLFLALLFSLIPTLFLSRRLQRWIVDPITDLAAAAHHVEHEADYSIRVEPVVDNELGVCINSFNSMLAQIQVRNEESEQLRRLMQNIIDSMPSVVICTDRHGNITWWNARAKVSTGKDVGEVLDKQLMETVPQLAYKQPLIEAALSSGQVQKAGKVAVDWESGTRLEDITVYPLRETGIGIVIRLDDVTDRNRMEEIMIQSEKMLSVGGLAAGMAHEINNPLAGIMQNIQVMRNRLKPDLPRNRAAAEAVGTNMETIEAFLNRRGIPAMVGAIFESGKRAAQIVDNMLSFSRKEEAARTYHDMALLLDKTVELASNDYDLKKKYDFRKIDIVRVYDPQAPEVLCEASKLQQVFLNLLKNGAEAMVAENKRRETTGEPPFEPRFTLRTNKERDRVRIELEDNGPGMDESTRKRVLEPFFTTKAVGEGTGLGLSVSYFIITENHRGTMEVESSPGRGARFVIRLPVH